MIYTTQVPHLDQSIRSCITLGKFDGLHRGHQVLIDHINHYKEKGMKAIVMKPKVDTKAGTKIQTRIGLEREVDYLIKEKDNLYEVINKEFNDVHCILIDEAQFLTREQVNDLVKVVVKLDIVVMCYGLRTDFLTNGFEGSTRLLEVANNIEELKTICKCGKKALYNARFINGKLVIKGDSIVIDNNSKVKYIAMCPKCYYEEIERLNL